MGRLKRKGVRINKIIQEEIKAIGIEVGMDVLEELAERIAEEARKNAKDYKLEDTERTYDVYKGGKIAYNATMPNRRGSNKKGKSDSGPLADTIVAIESPKVSFSMLVMSPAWYSHFVEFGTNPHEIKPKKSRKKGKDLVVPKTEDMAVATKKVNHPGYRQKPFLRPAGDKADDFMKDILKEKGLI